MLFQAPNGIWHLQFLFAVQQSMKVQDELSNLLYHCMEHFEPFIVWMFP